MAINAFSKKIRFDSSGNIGIGTNRPQAKIDVSGNVQVSGHILPGSNISYDIGSSTKRWRDIYLSGNTIDLGGTFISKEANGGIKIADSSGNTLDGKFNNLVINGAINQAVRLDVSGSILPTSNLVYDLGAPDKRWNDLYLSGNTIDLSGTLLSRHTDGSLMVHDSNNNMITGRFNDVTAEGNIGIGTNIPAYKLHVVGDTRIQGNLILNGTTTVVDTNVNTTEMLDITNDGTGPALRVTQTGVQPIVDFCDDNSNNVVMRIADGGNVGIGTLIPKSKLHVNGTITAIDVSANLFRGKLAWTDVSGAPPYELAPGSIIVYDGVAAIDSSFIPADGRTLNRVDYPELANALNIPVYQNTFTVSTPDDFQVNWNETDVSSCTYIVNKPNIYGFEGNVGIGTSNPGAALDVSGNIYVRDGSINNPALTFSTDTNTGFYRAGNDTLGLVTGGVERMRIDATGNTSFTGNVTASGNIGIGTSVPRAKLDVSGNINLNNTLIELDIAGIKITQSGNTYKLVMQQSGTLASRPVTARIGDEFEDTTNGEVYKYTRNGWFKYIYSIGTTLTSPATTAAQIYNNGLLTNGLYYITGTQGGSTIYNVYCDMNMYGGKWMLFAQLPKGTELNNISLYTTSTGTPSNLAASSYFVVPINILSNNSGYNVDIMVTLTGGLVGATQTRLGTIFRGINLTQALSEVHADGNAAITTASPQYSNDGISWGSAAGTYSTSSGWIYSISTGSSTFSYLDSNSATGGWILHSSTESIFSYFYGTPVGYANQSSSTNFDYARIWVRVN